MRRSPAVTALAAQGPVAVLAGPVDARNIAAAAGSWRRRCVSREAVWVQGWQ